MCDVLQLECPLKLIRFVTITDCGETSSSLKASSQVLKFKDAKCLIDNSLTLIIPKCIENKCNKYTVSIQSTVIQDMNAQLIETKIVPASNMCGYFLIIPITADMFDECDLTLEIVDFCLDLCPTSKACDCIPCHKYNDKSRCNVDFKWIASNYTDVSGNIIES